MSDDLERELDAMGRTLENQTSGSISPDVVRPIGSARKSKWPWIAAAAALIAIAGAAGVVVANEDNSTNIAAEAPDQPDVTEPVSTTTSLAPPETTIPFSTISPQTPPYIFLDRPITQEVLDALVPDDVLAIEGTGGWGDIRREGGEVSIEGGTGCEVYDSVNDNLASRPNVRIDYQNSVHDGVYLAVNVYLFDEAAEAATVSNAMSTFFNCTVELCGSSDSPECNPLPEGRQLEIQRHGEGVTTSGFSIGPIGAETFFLITASDELAGWMIGVEVEGGAYSPDTEAEVRGWLSNAIDDLRVQPIRSYPDPATSVPTTLSVSPNDSTQTTLPPEPLDTQTTTTYVEGPTTTLTPRQPIPTIPG